MSDQLAPFRVEKDRPSGRWILYMRQAGGLQYRGDFKTPGDAIDSAYRRWPWQL